MKILVTNTVALNGGDAAILLGTIELLQHAFGVDTEFVVFDSHPEVAQRYYPELTFRRLLYFSIDRAGRWRIRRLRTVKQWRFLLAAWCQSHNLHAVAKRLLTREQLRGLVDYSTADLVVSTGGTYLVESYQLVPRLFDYRVALLLGRPLVFFAQSIGPFRQESNRRRLRKVFERALLVLLRDDASHRHLEDLRPARCRAHTCSDAAFALRCARSCGPARRRVGTANERFRVAISVRQWQHFRSVPVKTGMERFCNAVAELTAHLVKQHGAQVTYISTCQGVSEYWTDDSQVAKQIVGRIPEEQRTCIAVDDSFHRPKELIQLLESYDFVLATRMHMAIFALLSGTPVVPISYEFKTRELFERLGQGKWVQDIENIDGLSLIQSVDAFIAAIPKIQETLFARVNDERARALRAAELVKGAYELWCERS